MGAPLKKKKKYVQRFYFFSSFLIAKHSYDLEEIRKWEIKVYKLIIINDLYI